MKIGIDAMGGDNAPKTIIQGAIMARKEMGDSPELVLIGKEKTILGILKEEKANPSDYTIINAESHIEMGENPVRAYSNKPDSSISIGFNLLKEGRIEGFASAGNTGAMLIGAMYTVKTIPGVIRPVITAAIPQETEYPKILMDVGINPDCKPDVLYQWAILGSIYMRSVYGIESPRIGLLNIGEEEEKGNLLTKSTYQIMKDTRDFNFNGNIEGNDIFNPDKADIIICDGFVGNVMLKQAEAFYSLIKKRKNNDGFFEKFNFEQYGGTPILGVNESVIIGHGNSNLIAIKNMIRLTGEVIEADVSEQIKQAFN
jgi:glycerol-3-phosphate acyltransferase PlsX